MQWQLARPGALAARCQRAGVRWGLPLAAALARRLPRRLLHLQSDGLTAAIGALLPSTTKQAIAGNLARVRGLTPQSRAIRRDVNAMLRNFHRCWVDLFYFGQRPVAHAMRLVDHLEGWHWVERAREGGVGAILMTAHLGNWEVGGMILGREDIPVSVVYVPDRYRTAERFRSRLRHGGDLEEIALHPDQRLAGLPILRALRDQRLVAVQGDRDFTGGGLHLPFFGAPAPFPRGPFELARMTGAPLIPFFIPYTEDRQLVIRFHPPITVDKAGDRDQAVQRAMETWVALLENEVASHPTQWYTFYDFWGHAGDGDPAAATAETSAATTPTSEGV